MIRHIVMDGPGHDLEQSAIERRRQTGSVRRSGAGWMEVIHVYTCPKDLHKFCKRMTAFRQARFVRSQVARDDVWKWTWPGEWPEIPATAKVSRGVHHGRLAKVWIASRGKFGGRALAVAAIAVALRVNNVAA
jgi:hypothetical protein